GVVKHYGNRISLSSIAKETEIGSHVTVREYLEILEELFLVKSVFQEKREYPAFRKMRKIYFIDPFLFHVFKSKTTGRKTEDSEIPHVVEGIVGQYLQRKFGEPRFYYANKEVDFIAGEQFIEVKWQKNVDSRDFPNIEAKNKLLLSREAFKIEKNIATIPVSTFMLV
ncbi:MAG: ATP-binding protein, partial [Candidatus Micrarchaeota archaeon]